MKQNNNNMSGPSTLPIFSAKSETAIITKCGIRHIEAVLRVQQQQQQQQQRLFIVYLMYVIVVAHT